MNKTLTSHSYLRRHGSCGVIAMWRADRFAGIVEEIF